MRVLCLIWFASWLVAAAQNAPERPARIPAGVVAGQLLTTVPPIYPAEAKKAQVEGVIVMHAVIGRDGHIANLSVVSGPDMLRDAAIDAVRQWTYKPYLLNGEPTEVDTTITVNFSLAPPPVEGQSASVSLARPLPPGRYRVSSGVIAGNRIYGHLPNLCELARPERAGTSMVLHVVIDRSGAVAEAEVVSGAQVLRQAAVDAIRQWTFKPYLLNGEPVEVDTTISFSEACGG